MLAIHRYFDISLARDVLNYRPIVSFAEGWKDTIAAQPQQRGQSKDHRD
jgi:nucleoside-diphosphate-sugar epimerase